MFDNLIPLVFCISLAVGAIMAWVKAEKKYLRQREKIMKYAQELQTTLGNTRNTQNDVAASSSSEKSNYAVIEKIARILDGEKNKTNEEKQIEKMIKRECSEIALAVLTNNGTPAKRDTGEAEDMFKRMKKEI